MRTTIRLATLLLALAMALPLAAQEGENFTLSDGSFLWLKGTGETYEPYTIEQPAYDLNDEEVYADPSAMYSIKTTMGNHLLRLNTETDPPTVQSWPKENFDLKCVWHRTGYTGYYYQEWEGYRYYLVGSSTGLTVSKVLATAPTDKVTLFYNWDFGAAIASVNYRNGNREENYYWIEYVDDAWTMSGSTYSRPEGIRDRRPVAEPSYCDAVVQSISDDNDTTWARRGQGAIYLPVDIIEYPVTITGDVDGKGLTGLTKSTSTPIAYGDVVTITPTINTDDQVYVRRQYKKYVVEKGRTGLNLDYMQRTVQGGDKNVMGIAGTLESDILYYYDDDTPKDDPPEPTLQGLNESGHTWTISATAKRWLRMEEEGGGWKLTCIEVPKDGATATVTYTVTYDNGLVQTESVDITFSGHVERNPMPTPTHAPVVHGYVVGGGKMANVAGDTRVDVVSCDSIYALYGGNDIAGWVQGEHGATINIGTTAKTDATHPVRIGYVYGGGCGYYTYCGINPSVIDGEIVDPYVYNSHKTNLAYQAFYFNGSVYAWNSLPADYDEKSASHEPADFASAAWNPAKLVTNHAFKYKPQFRCEGEYDPAEVDVTETGDGGDCMETDMGDDSKHYLGTIPYIKTATINVGLSGGDGQDNIRIDSLFGGAENAFIGVEALTGAAEGAVEINIHGGTLYAVFGGNNYGGSVANTSTVEVNVYNTKTTTDQNIRNTYFTNYGRHFGIRYLFGGGNLVDGSHAEVNIYGGMIDTVYLGGNEATVAWPTGLVNCTGNKFIFDNPSITKEWEVNSETGELEETGEDLPLYDATKEGHEWDNYDALVSHRPDLFEQNTGRYNVRCLFGGNNRAPMTTLGAVILEAGGISTVYGGGNAGDMRNKMTIDEMAANVNLIPTFRTIRDSIRVGLYGWGYGRPSILGSFVHSRPGSRIIAEQVYGGCRMANVSGSSAAWLSGGVFGYVQAGNDISGDVGSEVPFDVDDAAKDAYKAAGYVDGPYAVLDRKVVVLQDVYGGSDGYYHCSANGRYLDGQSLVDYNFEPYDEYAEFVGMLVPTHNNTNLYVAGGTVLFSAYTGGVKANTGFEQGAAPMILERDISPDPRPLEVATGDQKGRISMQIGVPWDSIAAIRADTAWATYMHGTARTKYQATHTNPVIGHELHGITGYSDGNAYGGGYLSNTFGTAYAYAGGYPTWANGEGGPTTIRGAIYAGNDCMGSINTFGAYDLPHANYRAADFAASDGTKLNRREADGTYNANFSTYLLVEGEPRINSVYGSGNGDYEYTFEDQLGPVCPDEYIRYGYTPLQASVFVDIHTRGGLIDTVFGGGNGVGVRDRVQILFNNEFVTAEQLSDGSIPLTVGTIFGGNNREDMNTCVPDIVLRSGKVQNVFGGGNAGGMMWTEEIDDICKKPVKGVSCYVTSISDSVIIPGSVYGGCRKADVKGMAYVQILKTHANGINYVFGGNDISGTVRGNTRIDVVGGKVNNIYGGSNGYYDYVGPVEGVYDVWAFGSDHSVAANKVAVGTSGMPFVDSTTVNLYGGIVDNSVYGGGRFGDCRATCVTLNDRVCDKEYSLTVNGDVFGGGEGDWMHLASTTHRGNVFKPENASSESAIGNTNLHLHHATHVGRTPSSKPVVYGGGQGGDVEDTYVNVYDTWDLPFEAIYGGCWGSHVMGTTHLELDGSMDPGALNADNVYGGNDYTGSVYRSVVRVHNGRYGNIYGGCNGEYDYSVPPVTGFEKPMRYWLPNIENVVVDFLDGEVTGNLYGGGNQGTTFAWQKESNGDYKYTEYTVASGGDGNLYRVPDTSLLAAGAHTDPSDYSVIAVNIHGGTFRHNIFAGASGLDNQLVYGLKMLNMDDGVVYESVYGGSERVNDGYVECQSTETTTQRPSSILNITGGNITASVYGAGYQGLTCGSVYVNIGKQAVENSSVWTKTVKGTANAYASLKPGVYTDGYMPATDLEVKHLSIGTSVYGGANWGNNAGSFDFRQPGFRGGESRILVDGQGYNTDNRDENHAPTMDIVHSIIGSGTSVQGGDVLNRIDVLNYGAEGDNCHATRQLHSIQRTHQLNLWNTAIHYIGSTDAATAYTSQQYTINRADVVNIRGYNVLELDALMTEIQQLHFYEDALDGSGNLVHTVRQHLTTSTNSNVCDEDATICHQLDVVDPTTAKYAALVINNGVSVEVKHTEVAGGVPTEEYGSVDGFGFIVAEHNTNGVVTARDKQAAKNSTDGGFRSTCQSKNQLVTLHEEPATEWADLSETPTTSELTNMEYQFNNYSNSYRVWSIGRGMRTRFAVILAHADPSKLSDLNNEVRLAGSYINSSGAANTYDFAIAKAQLVLPPTMGGHYYKIRATTGIVVEDETAAMRFTDSTWNPNWAGRASWTKPATLTTDGTMAILTPSEGYAGSLMGMKAIEKDSNATFGLLMTPSGTFTSDKPDNYTDDEWNAANHGTTAITGNKHVNITTNYATPKVKNESNISPVMDLYLTYNPKFSTTMLGTVSFILDEYDAEGHDLNMPVDVSITISTLLENFKDMEYDLLAMYNEGRTNVFTRSAVFPATLHSDRIYVEKVSWWPDKCAQEEFYLTGSEATVTGATNPNVFTVSMQPLDNVSSSLTSAIGWYSRSINEPIDIFTFAKDVTGKEVTDTMKYSEKAVESTATCANIDTLQPESSPGLLLGELDGRGLGSLVFRLGFDGNKVYPTGTVGHLDVKLKAIHGSTETKFKIRLNVICRERGDTIYIASKPTSITRSCGTVHQAQLSDIADANNTTMVGKRPDKYLLTFQEAFNNAIYREGDVICILDTVKVGEGQTVAIRGVDFAVPVIRYTGHHSDLPGECGAFRGTMIDVSGSNANFSANFIDFSGSATSRIWSTDVAYPTYYDAVLDKRTPATGGIFDNRRLDTTTAYGPIIAVHKGGSVTLGNGTVMHDNHNRYVAGTGSGFSGPYAHRMGGAVSVTNGGTLELMNNVTIEDNMTPKFASVDHPNDGAIYVDNGTLRLKKSYDGTAVTIRRNYAVDTSAAATGVYWKNFEQSLKLIRYDIDTTTLNANAQRRNVFLTRTAAAGEGDIPVMRDSRSDTIDVVADLPIGTRVGVSKWFPGVDIRDTIAFANGSKMEYLRQIFNNNNFFSDDGYSVFYNYDVSHTRMFLHRCATFRPQLAGLEMVYGKEYTPKQGNVLTYEHDENAVCPTGGDKIYFRVKGGFYPYTYTWDTGSVNMRTYVTPYDNVAKDVAIAEPGSTLPNVVATSSVDMFITPDIKMPATLTQMHTNYTISAEDAAGCKYTKRLKVTTKKTDGAVGVTLGTSPHELTDTNRANVAWLDRNFKGIKLNTSVVPAPSGSIAVYSNKSSTTDLTSELSGYNLCAGDHLNLRATADGSHSFIMWDFVPFDEPSAYYVVPNPEAGSNVYVTAYFSPNDYWKDVINDVTKAGAINYEGFTYDVTNPPADKGFVTTYNGDVHIYNENGLAWFISVVNGLNEQQARPFYFNRVFLHEKPDGEDEGSDPDPYDMKAHKWTPVGTMQHPFRGYIMGVGHNDTLPTDVVVKNIILNEPNMDNVGFFGFLDSAGIKNIHLNNVTAIGGQYVGGMAANSSYTYYKDSKVLASGDADPALSILATSYASGGLIGKSSHDVVKDCEVAAKYLGDAVYNGGVIGHGTSTTAEDLGVRNVLRLSSLYSGGIAGWMDGNAPNPAPSFFKSGTDGMARISNNYVRIDNEGNSNLNGGLVGYARNTIMENNYVYGSVKGVVGQGGATAVLDNGTTVANNYYERGSVDGAVGLVQSGAATTIGTNTDFAGSGNQVKTGDRVYGVDNLTRVLNIWVNERNAGGESYRNWRSDLEGENHGYPVFGTPDMIPVYDSASAEGCDVVAWNGDYYTVDTTFTFNVVDSAQMIDSTMEVRIRVHHGTLTSVSDSVVSGEGYNGHGFTLSATEIMLLRSAFDSTGHASVVVYDTLSSEYGCDSIVKLTLTVDYGNGLEEVEETTVNVYPNPTTSTVTVEARSMGRVEIYDNEGRRMADYEAHGADAIRLDLSSYSTGVYFVRVHTPQRITIQKVIKK